VRELQFEYFLVAFFLRRKKETIWEMGKQCSALCYVSYRRDSKQPITVGARSKARNVFACSNTGVVNSNPTQVMDVCMHLFCVCIDLCVGRVLAKG
jgi:hypothetical protein